MSVFVTNWEKKKIQNYIVLLHFDKEKYFTL